jgi:hypothetical protein
LLEIAALQSKLEDRFAKAGLARLLLRRSQTSPTQLANSEETLEVRFPEAFRRALLTFDFGDLAIGGVAFSGTGDYLKFLVTRNIAGENPWWGSGERPSGYLVVADTDGYVILLDVASGRLFAFERSENWTDRFEVAANFELFLRALVTAAVSNGGNESALRIAREVQAPSSTNFWVELMEGSA